MYKSPQSVSPSPSDLDRLSDSSLSETSTPLIIPELSFSKATTWSTRTLVPRSPPNGTTRLGSRSPPNSAATPSIFSSSRDHEQRLQRPVPSSRARSATQSTGIDREVPRPALRRQANSYGVRAEVIDATILTKTQSNTSSLADSTWSTTRKQSASSGQGSLASYKTEFSRNVEHGMPDTRMLDYARSLAKASRDARRKEELLKQSGRGQILSPSKESTSPDSHDAPVSLTHSALHDTGNGLQDQHSRSLSGHIDPSMDVPFASAPTTTHSSPISVSSSKRRGSTEHQEKGYFFFRQRPARPHGLRSASHQIMPSAARQSSQKSMHAQSQPGSSLSHIVDAPVSLPMSPLSPGPLSPISPTSPGSRRPSRLRRMFSAFRTLRPDAHGGSADHLSEDLVATKEVGGDEDYFGKPVMVAPTPRKTDAATAPATCYNAGEAVRISTPPELRKHRRRPRFSDDGFYDYLPAAGHDYAEGSHRFRSALDDSSPEERREMSKYNVIPEVGPLSDSSVVIPAIRDEDVSTPDWFRQRINDIMGEESDDNSSISFDWDIPLHLPNSPLCPLNPKYRGSNKGACAYHGRRKTLQGLADTEEKSRAKT